MNWYCYALVDLVDSCNCIKPSYTTGSMINKRVESIWLDAVGRLFADWLSGGRVISCIAADVRQRWRRLPDVQRKRPCTPTVSDVVPPTFTARCRLAALPSATPTPIGALRDTGTSVPSEHPLLHPHKNPCYPYRHTLPARRWAAFPSPGVHLLPTPVIKAISLYRVQMK